MLLYDIFIHISKKYSNLLAMLDKQRYQLSCEEELDILLGVINRFIGYFTRDSIRETKNDTKTEYPFVPMDTRQAFEQILAARRHFDSQGSFNRPLTFIDIGCGIGQIMLMAEMAGFDAFGIEKDPYPCTIAQRLMGKDKVLLEDIWNFDGYGNFDVIYYFRPFSTKELQSRFEKMVEDELKPGGLIIGNRRLSDSIENDKRFCRVDPHWPVWHKITA